MTEIMNKYIFVKVSLSDIYSTFTPGWFYCDVIRHKTFVISLKNSKIVLYPFLSVFLCKPIARTPAIIIKNTIASITITYHI